MSTQTITVGDVMNFEGEWIICSKWGESCATMQPMAKRVRTIQPRGDAEKFGGKEVKFTAPNVHLRYFSANTPGPFIARLGANWATKDFAKEVPGFTGEANVPKFPKQKPATIADPLAEQEKQHSGFGDGICRNHQVISAIKNDVAKAANPPKSRGKCAYLWSLLEVGGITRKEMVKLAVEKFGGTELATLRTISAIPSAMRKAGVEPKWKD